MAEPVRLHKFIAECGVVSRRKAEELIVAGKVMVNGQIVKELGTKIDPRKDRVQVRGKPVFPAEKGVVIFHKPRHMVSTLSDPEGRACLAHVITKNYQSYFPVGRLDYESTGLLVLTNDGEMADRLLHPRHGFARVYEVKVRGNVEEKTLRRLVKGVFLEDGLAKADVKLMETLPSATWLEVTIHVGKNRIVRRMMEHVRHTVIKLHRVRHGPFSLGKVKVGELNKLTEKEYLQLRERVMNDIPLAEDLGEKEITKPAAVRSAAADRGDSGESRKERYSQHGRRHKISRKRPVKRRWQGGR